MMSWLMENWSVVLMLAATCLGALVAVLKVVAPMTHTEWDNRFLAVLSKLVTVLSGFVSPKVKTPDGPA